MSATRPGAVAHALVAAINAHDTAAVAALLTPEHRFVDSLGVIVGGRDTLRVGWGQYFRMVPDYRIDIAHTLEKDADVVLLGTASGTYTTDGELHARNAWAMPGAWHAQVEKELVAFWQVFADNEPIRRCMRAAESAAHG
jgi:ketosteroid isomerase-like protein